VRQITLIFSEEKFEDIMGLIGKIREAGGHENNTDAVEQAIRSFKV
jgi:hypothetical protein